MEEHETEKSYPLREAKLLIIGAGGVGKTSLMTKLQNPNEPLKDTPTTIGIDVVEEKVPLQIEGKEFTMNIWDFGGQDVYHPTHQFFLTKNSVYVLMEDGREKKTDFYYWLQVQELLAGNSPLLIVQNIKEGSRSEIPNHLKDKFNNIKREFDIDLKNVTEECEDYKKILDLLKYELEHLPHINEVWPETRFKIRQKLIEQKEKHTISLEEYRKICNDLNYTDKQKQDNLLEQLHFLGTVLHFKDEGKLKGLVIVNPQWATDAVYAILDHTSKNYEKRGHFTWEDLEQVWKGEKYKGKFNEILALMEKFELSFELKDPKDTYIAPLLLPADKPNFDWDNQQNLQVHYEYDFLPKGTIARLIVRLHRRLKDHLFWKRGAIFEKENCQALVEEDYTGRTIKIRVKGEKARDLMVIVAEEIDKINKTYHFSEKIKATKLVPCSCHQCSNTKEEPYFFEYDSLEKRLLAGRETIECDKSYEFLPVQELLYSVSGGTQLKSIVKKMLAENRVKECFPILKSCGVEENQLVLLMNNFKSNSDNHHNDVIKLEEYNRNNNKIIHAILELLK